MGDPTEADFDRLWAKIRAKHDADHGPGDAERRAIEAAARFGIGFIQDGRHVPNEEVLVKADDDKEEGSTDG